MTFRSTKTSSQVRQEDLAMEVECPSCGAPPYRSCKSRKGWIVSTPHKRRMDVRPRRSLYEEMPDE
jgi:hypothetical protein